MLQLRKKHTSTSAQKLSSCYIDLTSFSITIHKILSINSKFCTKFNFTFKKVVKSVQDKKIGKLERNFQQRLTTNKTLGNVLFHQKNSFTYEWLQVTTLFAEQYLPVSEVWDQYFDWFRWSCFPISPNHPFWIFVLPSCPVQ